MRVLQQATSGIANAYNEGIQEAKGEYIAFISHDDLWLAGKLEKQIDYLANHPETDAVLCHVEHFLGEGSEFPPGFRPELSGASRPGWMMEALVAKPEIFTRVGGFDPAFAVSEDSDWFARALDSGVKLAVLPELLLRKRVYGGNATLAGTLTNPLLLRALRSSIQRKRKDVGDECATPQGQRDRALPQRGGLFARGAGECAGATTAALGGGRR